MTRTMPLFINTVRPLGIFEDLPYELVLLIEKKRHRILMQPVFETINKYVPKPEIQHYIDYYVGPVILSYEGDEYTNYELNLPHGMFFLGRRTNGMTNLERRMINWTLERRMFVRNTRKQYAMSMLREKKKACQKYEYVLSVFDKAVVHDDTDSDWTHSELSEGFEEVWSSDDEFNEREFEI